MNMIYIPYTDEGCIMNKYMYMNMIEHLLPLSVSYTLQMNHIQSAITDFTLYF